METAVIGSRGYLGRELVRLLLQHPEVDTIHAASAGGAGAAYADAVPGFHGNSLQLVSTEAALSAGADVVFFATEHGVAAQHEAVCGDSTVIDLSRDHRLPAIAGAGWTYGLADLRPVPKGSKRISNPGCYPTATMLAAAPALQAGITEGVLISDGKSGVSGAGATPRDDLHFASANESMRAYKVLGHDHQAEMAAMAGAVAGRAQAVRFTPHLVPMNRGLLATIYLHTDAAADEVKALYADAYRDSPFVHVRGEPATGNVAGTNHAEVAVDVDQGILVARCAIDNLRKGGSGQAVQNMNDALGLPCTTGLTLAGGLP